MTILFLSFMYTVVKLSSHEDEEKTLTAGGLGVIDPSKQEATIAQIQSPQPEQIVGPDKSYIINKPPKNWSVREVTFSEWIELATKITDPDILKKMTVGVLDQQARDILWVEAETHTIMPIPGKTTIERSKNSYGA